MKTSTKLITLIAMAALSMASVATAQRDPVPAGQPGVPPNTPPFGGDGGGSRSRSGSPPDGREGVARERASEDMARAGQQMMMAQQHVDQVMSMFGRPDGGRALLVHSTKQDPGAGAAMEEDLNVMSRILEKAINREAGSNSPDKAMGIFVSTSPGGRSPQSIYLEGYGAVFLLNARFPLVSTPARDQGKTEKPDDSSWEEAKREIYGGRGGQGMGGFGLTSARMPQLEFNPEKVENLKKDLLAVLKNASNIRHLKHDENVVVVVSSPEGGGAFEQRLQAIVRPQPPVGDRPGEDPARDPSGKSEPRTKTVRGGASGGAGFRPGASGGAPRSSTMTIRVKKSDIDSFAAGKMDFDDFRKKASVIAY